MPNGHAAANTGLTERSEDAALDHLEHSAHSEEGHDEHEAPWLSWLRVGFVAALIVVVRLGVAPRFHGIDIVAVVGILIGGFPIYKEAIADIVKGRMTMELSMTIALV